jgi:hypothetical protein
MAMSTSDQRHLVDLTVQVTDAQILTKDLIAVFLDYIGWNISYVPIGALLDARDIYDAWYPARIVDRRFHREPLGCVSGMGATAVLVHYEGWSSQCDEWIEEWQWATRLAEICTRYLSRLLLPSARLRLACNGQCRNFCKSGANANLEAMVLAARFHSVELPGRDPRVYTFVLLVRTFSLPHSSGRGHKQHHAGNQNRTAEEEEPRQNEEREQEVVITVTSGIPCSNYNKTYSYHCSATQRRRQFGIIDSD